MRFDKGKKEIEVKFGVMGGWGGRLGEGGEGLGGDGLGWGGRWGEGGDELVGIDFEGGNKGVVELDDGVGGEDGEFVGRWWG